jgi:glycosyltransferase involved in cell wall biosynthesis
MPSLSVIVPVYNEEEAVGGVLNELHDSLDASGEVAAYEILVVDDGSTDGTAEAVRRVEDTVPHVRLLARPRNRGYGAAIKHGLQNAAHGVVAIIDGDGSYPPDALPTLLREMGDAAMVVGAREPGEGLPLIRRPAKWVLRTLASYLAEEPIPDLNSGLRVFRKDACLRFFRLLPSRFSFTTTLTLAMLCDEMEVRYVPITCRRRTGRSKIRPVRDTLGFLMLIAQTVTYFRPLKVLGPLAATVFLVGLAKGVYDLTVFDPETGPNLKTSDLLLLVAGIQVFALGLLADMVAKRR